MNPATSDPQLRALIESQVNLSGYSDLERARALRAFAHQLVPLPWTRRSLQSRFGNEIQYEPLSVLMPLLAKQENGFECGGTAYVLARLYHLFDLEAYVYNAGISSTQFSHCVTFVSLRHEGGNDLFLQDAHFNAELRAQDALVPLDAALDSLAIGRGDSLCWHGEDSIGRLGVVSAEAEPEAKTLWQKHYDAERVGDSCDSALYRLQFSLGRYHLRPQFEDALSQVLGSSAFPAFLLLPLGTSGEAQAEAIAEKARLAHAAATAFRSAPPSSATTNGSLSV